MGTETKKINIGDKFGRWTVIEKSKSDKKHSFYKCKCSCGNIKVVRADILKLGKSKSCGCLRAEKAKQIKIGDRFKSWEVIETVNADKKVKCRCECGTERWVSVYALLSGRSTNCGLCIYKYSKEQRAKRMAEMDKKILNKKFGKLTPIKCVSSGRRTFYKCKCDCGNTVVVRADSLLSHNTISCGCNFKTVMTPYLVDDTNLLRLGNKPIRTSQTGVRGVTLTACGTYKATITFQKKKYYLGTFRSLEEAKIARQRAEEKYFDPMLKKHEDVLPKNRKANNEKKES